MKARELMIGDWVYVSENFTQKYHKVRYIDADGVIGCLYVNEYGIECKSAPVMDSVQPITLTKEILEQNGWRMKEWDGEYTHDDVNMFLLTDQNYVRCVIADYYKFGKFNKHGVSYAELCKLHYVHEFQHALRLCGLNELADNLKI